MDTNLFWFSDKQWAKIVPHLPTNQPGPQRGDDRRILSGIMHVLTAGCRWKDCPKEYGPFKTVYNRFVRWSERGIWQKIFAHAAAPEAAPEQAALDSTHVKLHRCAAGGQGGPEAQAIGLTKGGRNSKIHAIVDQFCRPWAFILTPGNTADCVMAEACVSLVPGIKELLADKGYDTDAIRTFLKEHGIKATIPSKSNRKKKIRHDKQAYKGRNVVERCFCRLKDFRRIATRYDKLAQNFFSALCLVATVAYWI
ncbi:IS5 family transposase [Beijerinckia indica]|uniref:IS5 family transposase n=1 Tax=Beijerinckia indica TaxID=533 RepID=UPI000A2F4C94|nr:IS5 family transposase [Beijerinckia indica]